VNFYSWDSNGSTLNDGWPGQTITDVKEAGGFKFYYQTYEIPSKDYYMNFVFNQGGTTAGEHQTVDVTNVKKTSVFEVTSQTNKYEITDVTDIYLPLLLSVPGDVNGDGEVGIADVNVLINMILNNDQDPVGDVNGDHEVGIADVNVLIGIILNS
jgi:hypothetical protein